MEKTQEPSRLPEDVKMVFAIRFERFSKRALDNRSEPKKVQWLEVPQDPDEAHKSI